MFRHVETLRGLRLPEGSGLARDHVLPDNPKNAEPRARYDTRTLLYDAVRLEDERVLLTCPALMNLERPLRAGLRAPDAPPRRLRHWRVEETDQFDFALPGGSLTIEIAGGRHPVPLRQSHAAAFAGLNALLAMNKDNDPAWIRDWARYHVAAHDAQALVLFDNASETYEPETLLAALEETGLQAVAIYVAPFPYGPARRARGSRRNARLLQTSLLNLARRDMLARAGAVLSIDIDEIVRAPEGGSVFALARRRRHRFVKIHGSWVFPGADVAHPVPHRLHDHRAVPNARCNQKWCAVPSGAMSRLGWAPHHVGGRFVQLVWAAQGLELLHCRGTSTGWKRSRGTRPPRLAPDPDLQRFFADWFPA